MSGGAADRWAADAALPLPAVFPGLAFIVALDVAAVAGWLRIEPVLLSASTLVLGLLPWITLLVLRRPPSSLGYVRPRALVEAGWGALAGAVWRGASMGFNLLWHTGKIDLGALGAEWISALVLVPLVEETFYRGYLMRSLGATLGLWPAVMLQAILFAFHPVHWVQGWPAFISIFGFGLLAGWLMSWRRTIWVAWGAHGFANILPSILLALSS